MRCVPKLVLLRVEALLFSIVVLGLIARRVIVLVDAGRHESLGNHRALTATAAMLLGASVVRTIQHFRARRQIVHVSLVHELRATSRRQPVSHRFYNCKISIVTITSQNFRPEIHLECNLSRT